MKEDIFKTMQTSLAEGLEQIEKINPAKVEIFTKKNYEQALNCFIMAQEILAVINESVVNAKNTKDDVNLTDEEKATLANDCHEIILNFSEYVLQIKNATTVKTSENITFVKTQLLALKGNEQYSKRYREGLDLLRGYYLQMIEEGFNKAKNKLKTKKIDRFLGGEKKEFENLLQNFYIAETKEQCIQAFQTLSKEYEFSNSVALAGLIENYGIIHEERMQSLGSANKKLREACKATKQTNPVAPALIAQYQHVEQLSRKPKPVVETVISVTKNTNSIGIVDSTNVVKRSRDPSDHRPNPAKRRSITKVSASQSSVVPFSLSKKTEPKISELAEKLNQATVKRAFRR